MSKKSIYCMTVLMLHIFVFACNESSSSKKQEEIKNNVTIVDKGTYYDVVIDFKNGCTHYQVGEEFGTKIKQAVPDFEFLVDSYINELLFYYSMDLGVSKNSLYQTILSRVNDIKPQVPQDYIDEIEGASTTICSTSNNICGDTKLSKSELYMMSLILDTFKTNQCSAISVFDSSSETNKTITGRIVDWYDGAQNQLSKIQAVTTIKNGNKSIVLIGHLGYISGDTYINDNNIFAAILESEGNETYSSVHKRSYAMDIRYAMENYDNMNDVANFLKDPNNQYVAGHLVFLSDSNESKVLENNLTKNRELRTGTSALNPNITWNFPKAVAAVNSFILNGNYDNHTIYDNNFNRWNSIETQLASKGSVVSVDEIKQIVTYYIGAAPGSPSIGDVYNDGTMQIIIFQPFNNSLEVFFKPKNGILPIHPTFETIKISF